MTPEDLQRIRSSPGWRRSRVELFHDTSQGSVIVKGQRAARPAWRCRLLNGIARLIGLQELKAAPAHGGARAQAIEVERLRRLAAAGVAVPRLLHVEDDFFVQARGWLAYLHAGALAFRLEPPAPRAACVVLLQVELAHERAPVRQLVADTARRLHWVQRLPAGDGRGWRRHVAILQWAVGLMLTADIPEDNPAERYPATARR